MASNRTQLDLPAVDDTDKPVNFPLHNRGMIDRLGYVIGGQVFATALTGQSVNATDNQAGNLVIAAESFPRIIVVSAQVVVSGTLPDPMDLRITGRGYTLPASPGAFNALATARQSSPSETCAISPVSFVLAKGVTYELRAGIARVSGTSTTGLTIGGTPFSYMSAVALPSKTAS